MFASVVAEQYDLMVGNAEIDAAIRSLTASAKLAQPLVRYDKVLQHRHGKYGTEFSLRPDARASDGRGILFRCKMNQKRHGKPTMNPDEKPEDRQILCSSCLQIFSESLVHVIPYFNSSVNGYVTTYRCEQCWIPALEETRARLASTQDEAEIASAANFFQRHGVHIHEFMRGDPASVVRKILLRMIDLLGSEGLRLSIGRDHPPDEKRSAALKKL
jgi:hypothetical protein